MKRYIQTTRAFTLIELMVVVSIISMLASVVIASVQPMRAQAMDAKRKQEIHSIDLAIQQYIADKGYPPDLDSCAAQVPYDGGLLSGCVAVSTQGLDGFPTAANPPTTAWGKLAQQLSPYIRVIPSDPCTGSCLAEDGVTPLAYTYMAPAAVQFASGGSNSNYQLSAVLQTGSNTSGSTGGDIAVSPFVQLFFDGNPLSRIKTVPYNSSVTFNWNFYPTPSQCYSIVSPYGNNPQNIPLVTALRLYSPFSFSIQQPATLASDGSVTINGFPSDTVNTMVLINLRCNGKTSQFMTLKLTN